MKFNRKKVDSHLALQVEPCPLLTEQSLIDHKIVKCGRCDNYESLPASLAPVVHGGFQIKSVAWPVGKHLVQMEETLEVLCSEKFIEIVRKYELTGIAFESCGTFVN